MVLVLLVTTLIPQVSNVTKAKADEITGFNNSNMPVVDEMLRWDMGSKYVYGSEYIEVGNLVKQDEAKATYERVMESALVGDYITRLRGATKNPWIVYKEVGVIVENGVQKKVDIKVTVTDWELDSAIEDDYFIFTSGGAWITMRGVRWVDMKYEFFPSGTDYSNESALASKKIEVNGVFSQVDLDISQYFLFNEDESGVSQISNDLGQNKINLDYDQSDHITFENDVTIDGKVYDKVQASRTQLDGNTVTYEALSDKYTPVVIDGATLSGYVSLRFKSDTVKFRFGVRDDDIYSRYKQHVYGIIPYSIASFEAPKPLKYVIDDTGLDANGNTVVKPATEVYIKDGDTSVTYVIDVFLPRSLRNNYNKFILNDVLDEVYNVSSKAKISIYQDSDFAVTGKLGLGREIYGENENFGWFSIAKSNTDGSLKFTATNVALNNESFFGHSYQFVITTNINKSDLETQGEQTTEGYYKIPNVATCTTGVWTVNQTTGVGSYKDETGSTNEVMVYYTEPVLEIIKKVKDKSGNLVDAIPNVSNGELQSDYIVGDEVEFEVLVVNTNPISQTRNLQIWDMLPGNFTLDEMYMEIVDDNIKQTSEVYGDGYNSSGYVKEISVSRMGFSFKGYFGAGTITDNINLKASGDYVKLFIKGRIKTSDDMGINTAYAKNHYDYAVYDSASIQSSSFIPILEVTKSILDDSKTVEDETSVRITIQQSEANARKDQIAEITGIFDKMYGVTPEEGYVPNADVFELASPVKLYKVNTAGVKTEIFIDSHEDYYFGYEGTGSSTSFDNNYGFHYGFDGGESDSELSDWLSYLPLAYGEKLYIEYDIIPHTIPENLYNPTGSTLQYYYDRPYYNIVGVNQSGIKTKESWWKDVTQDEMGVDISKTANYVASDSLEVDIPTLKIMKTSDKDVYEYGETAHYTVTLEQTNPEANVSVLFTDYFMDDIFASTGLGSNNVPYTWYEDVLESVKISDLLGNDRTSEFDFNFYKYNDASLPEETEGYSPGPVLMATLKDGYEFNIGMGNGYIITYDVPLTLSCFKDRTLTNRADLTAKLADSVYAENTIQVVTPKIAIDKTVTVAKYANFKDVINYQTFTDEVIAEKGNRVWYKLNVSLETVNEDGLVKVLTIEDEIPEGMTLDASSIYMYDSQGQNITNEDNIFTTTSGGFIIEMARAYDTRYTVYYSAKVSDSVDGNSAIVNTAYASAINTGEVSDTATVKVRPRPVLSIDKYSDKTNYTLGETGHYTIEVTNTVENSIARDIQVFDVIEDSVTVKESTIKATLIKSGATTGESWVVQPDTYSGTVPSVNRSGECIDFYIGGDTGSADLPDLEFGDKLTVEYDVVYNEAGDVVNDAEAYSSNADYVSTTNTVSVSDPSAELTIDKHAHKNSFVVGESPYYTLEISQVKEDAVAENITIVDYFDVGLELDVNNIYIYDNNYDYVDLNDLNVEPTITQVVKDGKVVNKLTIANTGLNLAYEEMLYVEYQSDVVKEGTFVNTAYASADNAPEVSDDETVIAYEPLIDIEITKKIKVDDIHFMHGNPIFIINLKGTDRFGKTHNLNKVIEFTEGYVEENSDGTWVQMTVTFEDMPRGKYTASEGDVMRYRFSKIENYRYGTVNQANGTILFNTSNFSGTEKCYATFVNDKYEWQGYSDTSRVTNEFNTSLK